jgi:leucine-rich PPR motif-containing protein
MLCRLHRSSLRARCFSSSHGFRAYAIQPPNIIFNRKIRDECQKGNVEKAVSILYDMKKKDITPDSYTFTPILDAFAKKNAIQKVTFMIKEMREKFKFKPDAYHMNVLMDAYARAKMMPDMQRTLQTMIKEGIKPDGGTFTPFLKSYAKMRDAQKAKQLLEEMEHVYKVKPGIIHKVCTLDAIINGESIFSARKYFDEIPDKNVVAYNTMIDGYIDRNFDNISAKEFIRPIQQLFDQMLENNVQPDAYTFTHMIAGYAKVGDDTKALEMHDMMKKYGFKPDKYAIGALINAYMNVGKIDTALEYFEKVNQDMVMCSTIISGLFKNGRIQQGREMFEEMYGKGMKPDIIFMNSMVVGYIQAGEKAKAFNLVYEMKKMYGVGPSTTTYNILFECECTEDMDRALKIFEKIPIKDTRIYNTLFKNLSQVGRFRECIVYLRRMVEESNLQPDKTTLSIILNAFIKQRRFNEAWSYFESVKFKDTVMFNIMISGFSDEPDKVEELIQKMDSEGVKRDALTFEEAIKVFVDAKDIQKAKYWYHKMKQENWELTSTSLKAKLAN